MIEQVRRVMPRAAVATGAIGVMSLVVGGIGVATAANNGPNGARALAAHSVGSKASKSTTVKGSAAEIRGKLGDRMGVLLPAATAGPPEVFHPVMIVETAKLAAGTYEATASATGSQAMCWIATSRASHAEEFSLIANESSATTTQSIHAKKHQRIGEYCATVRTGNPGTNPGNISEAGITAIAVTSNAAGKAAKRVPLPLPSLSAIAQP
jgi:hypothetical protein